MTEETDHPAGEEDVETVGCPHCQNQQEVRPVRIIRGSEDDETLQQLFKGRINIHTCTVCSEEFFLQFPVLYRADGDELFVYYLPDQEIGEQEAEEKLDSLIRELLGLDIESPDIPPCRLTFTQRRFLEKIAIHEQNMDDRLIEYVKYQLYQRDKSQIDPVRTEILYDFSCEHQDKLRFLLFERETGEFKAAAHIPMEVYEETANAFRENTALQHELNTLFSHFRVDVDMLSP